MQSDLLAGYEHQRLLFAELQHRVTNNLQLAVAFIGRARRQLPACPEKAISLLDEAERRLLLSAEVHRRMHDPASFAGGIEPLLRDIVSAAIDADAIVLHLDVDTLKLTFEQMNCVAMVVFEAAMNAHKHVFRHRLGTTFSVHLKARPDGQALLHLKDDGPVAEGADRAWSEGGLGRQIIGRLGKQLDGTVTVRRDAGTEIVVVFPLPVERAQHRQRKSCLHSA